jgi:hypothetical protein
MRKGRCRCQQYSPSTLISATLPALTNTKHPDRVSLCSIANRATGVDLMNELLFDDLRTNFLSSPVHYLSSNFVSECQKKKRTIFKVTDCQIHYAQTICVCLLVLQSAMQHMDRFVRRPPSHPTSYRGRHQLYSRQYLVVSRP